MSDNVENVENTEAIESVDSYYGEEGADEELDLSFLDEDEAEELERDAE
ncbi:hypothetical protein FWD07_00210 [Candidatus Saccharibacteria bacterium]|nr:hypothetical protein [Candidatus Saccharibacteria bacterium]